MKKSLKKLKKKNKLEVLLYFAISILYLLGLIVFIKNILGLKGIENVIRFSLIVFFCVFWIFYLVIAKRNILKRRHFLFSLKTVLAILFILIFAGSSKIIEYALGKIQNLEAIDKVKYTAYLIKLNDTEFNNNSTLGLINEDSDFIVHTLGDKIIKDNKLSNKVNNYDDYLGMLNDLYDKKIDAIFIQDNFISLYESEERFANIASETAIVYQATELMTNEDALSFSTKDFTEPITILIMGVDSTIDGLNANAGFNGDTLMLITFNPHNLNATMFSIPRDTYVPIVCKKGNKAKINSAAAYGTNCVIDTVENFTGINIDYYVKINFKGVVDLVEALHGIDVYVEKPDVNTYKGQVCEQNSDRMIGSHLVCMDPGYQTLNGEQALAYSRCRHLYFISDLARIKHQQDVVASLGQKAAKLRSYTDFKNVVDAVTKNISTNMTTSQMLSAYNVLKSMIQNAIDGQEFMTINKSYLEVYNMRVFVPASNMYTSALGYYPASLEAIVKAMKVNLEIEKPEMIKTFDFSVNTIYEIKAAGEGIRGGSTDTTLLNFENSTVGYTQAWCNKNNLKCDFEEVDQNSEFYKAIYDDGMVVGQSVHDGTLLSNISSVKFYVNKKLEIKTKTEENKEEKIEESNKNELENKNSNASNEELDLNPILEP